MSQEVLSYHILGDRWVWGSLGCSLMVFCQFLAVNMSTLSLSAFTVERYIAICHPMKAQVNNICTTTDRFKSNCRISQYICTMSRARRIIISCWVFCVLYSSPWLALTQIKYACVQGIGLVRLAMFNIKYRYNVPFGKVLTISFNYGYVSQLITQLVTQVSSL